MLRSASGDTRVCGWEPPSGSLGVVKTPASFRASVPGWVDAKEPHGRPTARDPITRFHEPKNKHSLQGVAKGWQQCQPNGPQWLCLCATSTFSKRRGRSSSPRAKSSLTVVPHPRGFVGDFSAVAAVIHTASDQSLREPEQANETGRDDQQSQGSSGESGVKNYSARERAILELLAT